MQSKSNTPSNDSSGSAAPASQEELAAGGGPSGTESSNTVPCNSISVNVLRSGVDSLYLSYQGKLRDKAFEKLIDLKKAAQSKIQNVQATAQYVTPEHVFEVKGQGRHPFAYILKDGWFSISLSKPSAKAAPLAYCQISSELLTTMQLEEIVNRLNANIYIFGQVDGRASVSRSDLCVDFTTDFDVGSIRLDQWVTRARDIRTFTDNRQVSGFFIGGKGGLVARLYNKTLEMKNRPRPYLEQLWRKKGWDGNQTVWRLEFEFKRYALRGLGVVSVDSLQKSLDALWKYAMTDWLRLTVPNPNDKTQSRWPNHLLWDILTNVNWGNGYELCIVKREPDKHSVPSDRFLFVNGLSPITSFMAREGITNFDSGLSGFGRAARHYHDERSFETGEDFDNYVNRMVRAKFRRFCIAENKPLSESESEDNWGDLDDIPF